MMSAANNTFDAFGMKECFYYTNITPQTPELNRGLWKTLESKERELAKSGQEVTVIFGNTGSQDLIGVNHDITVPEYCWKVIIAADAVRHIADTLAYLIPDSLGLEKDLENIKFPVSSWNSGQAMNLKTSWRFRNSKPQRRKWII